MACSGCSRGRAGVADGVTSTNVHHRTEVPFLSCLQIVCFPICLCHLSRSFSCTGSVLSSFLPVVSGVGLPQKDPQCLKWGGSPEADPGIRSPEWGFIEEMLPGETSRGSQTRKTGKEAQPGKNFSLNPWGTLEGKLGLRPVPA